MNRVEELVIVTSDDEYNLSDEMRSVGSDDNPHTTRNNTPPPANNRINRHNRHNINENETEEIQLNDNISSNTTPAQPLQDVVFDAAFTKLKQKLSVVTIRLSTVHLIIKHIMETVEETPLKGEEQRNMALKLMRATIIDFTDGADEEVLLQLLDDGTIGNFIDLIVDATHGKLNINSAINVGSGCIRRCIPYFC